ncbi:hypothetical protein [Inmirania thermothiophila]|nr:hypothetical protein [Inmirania thermothiophila]
MRLARRGLAVLALLLGAAAPAAALERFSYCGHLLVTGGLETPQGTAMPAAPVMPFVGGYLGPLGLTPVAPRTCVYVRLGPVRDGRYLPTIVVWSDLQMPVAYHADIYSDAEGIFGHRPAAPYGGAGAGTPSARELEAALEAAAGEPVLLAVLDALGQGERQLRLDRDLIPVLVPGTAQGLTLSGRYEITEIRADPRFPAEVLELLRDGQARRTPHSPGWRAIAIPADKVPPT